MHPAAATTSPAPCQVAGGQLPRTPALAPIIGHPVSPATMLPVTTRDSSPVTGPPCSTGPPAAQRAAKRKGQGQVRGRRR